LQPPTWAALPAAEPPASLDLANLDPVPIVAALAALCCSCLFASLRRAMASAQAERVLGLARDVDERSRLEPLLERLSSLATSAWMLESGFSLLHLVLLVRGLAGDQPLSWPVIALAMVVAVPTLWLVNQALAQALALRFGDGLLVRVLPGYRLLHMPLSALAWPFEALRGSLLRMFDVEDRSEATRELVAGLREVLVESEASGTLDDVEREMIGNIMEVREEDVTAVMTPRTEIHALAVDADLLSAARVFTESGCSRLPVYEESIDNIIGSIGARDLVQVFANERLESTTLRDILRPAYFVPETKKLPELLAELRTQKVKLAIVLDEYGGTAGIVTTTDLVSEIIGELSDESDEEEPDAVRLLGEGVAVIDATTHVTDVNEALDLSIPEEADYETLGGFVLAELGRFPEAGERFERSNAEFEVLDANDRRVLSVRVRRLREGAA
jgi:CBS domain containing-hemolysin-like protein